MTGNDIKNLVLNDGKFVVLKYYSTYYLQYFVSTTELMFVNISRFAIDTLYMNNPASNTFVHTNNPYLNTNNTSANPTLDGTEADLTGIKIYGTKYKVSSVEANPVSTTGSLTAIGINGTNYAIAGGTQVTFVDWS
jgi:hypothetical protein